jgi:hypothetical protein
VGLDGDARLSGAEGFDDECRHGASVEIGLDEHASWLGLGDASAGMIGLSKHNQVRIPIPRVRLLLSALPSGKP